MKIIKFLIIIFIYFFSFFSFSSFSNEKNSDLENKIFKNLRCIICQGQSIYDSQSDFAESMKLVVKKKLESGMSEDEIYIFLKISMVNGFRMILNLILIRTFYGVCQF